MLDQGVIEESTGPWMVPMVFVGKKLGEIHLCVDNHELNKMTKDAYSLPFPDKVQCGYWQMPVHPDDQE